MESYKMWIVSYIISTIIVLAYNTKDKKVDLYWICVYLGISILLLLGFIGINM
jgi:hypothetical protein